MTPIQTKLDELKADWKLEFQDRVPGALDIYSLIRALEVAIGQRNRIAKKPVDNFMGDAVIEACDNAIQSILNGEERERG